MNVMKYFKRPGYILLFLVISASTHARGYADIGTETVTVTSCSCIRDDWAGTYTANNPAFCSAVQHQPGATDSYASDFLVDTDTRQAKFFIFGGTTANASTNGYVPIPLASFKSAAGSFEPHYLGTLNISHKEINPQVNAPNELFVVFGYKGRLSTQDSTEVVGEYTERHYLNYGGKIRDCTVAVTHAFTFGNPIISPTVNNVSDEKNFVDHLIGLLRTYFINDKKSKNTLKLIKKLITLGVRG